MFVYLRRGFARGARRTRCPRADPGHPWRSGCHSPWTNRQLEQRTLFLSRRKVNIREWHGSGKNRNQISNRAFSDAGRLRCRPFACQAPADDQDRGRHPQCEAVQARFRDVMQGEVVPGLADREIAFFRCVQEFPCVDGYPIRIEVQNPAVQLGAAGAQAQPETVASAGSQGLAGHGIGSDQSRGRDPDPRSSRAARGHAWRF